MAIIYYKRVTYVLVDLTAYRNIHECKYKQFMNEEFCFLVKPLSNFYTSAQPTLYRASEGAATPRVITLDAHGGKDFLPDL